MAKKPEIVANLIKSKINGNHLIHDAAHIGIDVKTTGMLFWKKSIIKITGRVDTENEKTEIDKIVESESNGCEVVSSLRVERR